MKIEDQLIFEKKLYREIRKAFTESDGDMEKAMALVKSRIGQIIKDAQWEAFVVLMLLLMMWDDDFKKANILSTDRERLRLRVEQASQEQYERLIQQMEETNEKRIASALDDLDDEPTEDPEVVINIGDTYLLSDKRAEDIAITEITHALSAGEDVAAEVALEFGLVLEAVWETSLDERVCIICGPLHGKHERNWPTLYWAGPPVHVRCRCRKKWELVNA